MNIYSDSFYSILKYLKNTEVNIPNLLIITGDFNIRDSIWDPSFPYHSAISDDLMIIADSLNLDLSISTHYVLTRYLDMAGNLNLVIDLMFLQSGSTDFNNHSIHSDWWLSLDHASLTVSIPIAEENIVSLKFSIVKNSKEEASFIKDVSYAIKNTWRANSKWVNITRHSKSWWNKECSLALSNYRTTRSLENWKIFKSKVKTTKQSFFNIKIQEITNKKQGPWELMN